MKRSISTLLVGILAVSAVATLVHGQPSPKRGGDPRCTSKPSDYCTFLDAAHDPSFHSDSSACSNGGPCPRCIDPAILAQAQAQVGDVSANSNVRVNLQTPNWLTAELASTMFNILSTEVLNYNTVPYQATNDAFQMLCCGGGGATKGPVIGLEGWPSTQYPEDDGYFTMQKVPIGYEGASGLFVKQSTIDKYPLATAYNAYKYLPEYSNVFPKAYSIPWQETVKNVADGQTTDNYLCSTETWSNTSCGPQGRYVPPQCEGTNSQYCQEIIMAMPGWDKGFFEGLIKNTGLNFTLVYVGYANHLKLTAQMGDILYYWWEPDAATAKFGSQAINFKPSSASCQARQNNDPTLSTADCAYPKAALYKAARRDELNAHPQLKFLFESFAFGAATIENMIVQHPSADGTSNAWNISCNWINNNYATWQSWLRASVPPPPVPEDPNAARMRLITYIAPPVIVVIILIIVVIVRRNAGQKSVEHAPKKPPLTLIFTDIENSTHLWEVHGADMGRAVEIHHEVIRNAIAENNCYEIKVVGDAFMIACPTALDALTLSMSVQEELQAATWPPGIINWKHDASDPENGKWFNGLRVRIGFHHCVAVDAKYDMIHQAYDYYGPEVNLTARIQSVAKGGQTLIGEETLEILRKEPDFAFIDEEVEFKKFASGVELKGVKEPIVVYSLLPMQLSMRRFGPIEGAKDETTAEMPDAFNISAPGLNGGEEMQMVDLTTISISVPGAPTGNSPGPVNHFTGKNSQLGGADTHSAGGETSAPLVGSHPMNFAVHKLLNGFPSRADRIGALDMALHAIFKNKPVPSGSYQRKMRALVTELRRQHDEMTGALVASDNVLRGASRNGSRRGSASHNPLDPKKNEGGGSVTISFSTDVN